MSLIQLDNQTFKNKYKCWFEDINKNNKGRYEGKLGGNDLYFDSLDTGCDISEEEGDHVESDEVVDPPARNTSTKRSTTNLLYSEGCEP
ncbi:hypothetical protein KY290_008069 [Solanum tuberosum]|uniref:Uncharacterized protein n=1 Tax=Solanum tuberosum TaxID=4113 RepID=A0ABQ7W7E9_SOLTU|nr:hypothetical protein KY290_008069 [Solanum tuberosum]